MKLTVFTSDASKSSQQEFALPTFEGDKGLQAVKEVVVAHQANGRIVEAVGRRLEIDPEKVPMNLDRYGNTTAATIPLLFHESRQQGLVPSGSLVAFTAFGAGAHWGAIAYQQP